MDDLREVRLRKALRGTVLVITVATLVAIVLGFFPGHEVYENGILVERTRAGGGGFTQFAWWLVAPGLVVWLHPRRSIALGWSLLAWLGTLMLLGRGFDLDAHGVNVTLWPATAISYLMGPVLFTLLLAMPFGLAIHEALERRADRRAMALANPPMPVARVVRSTDRARRR